jgi:hypothetical protein
LSWQTSSGTHKCFTDSVQFFKAPSDPRGFGFLGECFPPFENREGWGSRMEDEWELQKVFEVQHQQDDIPTCDVIVKHFLAIVRL